MATNLVLYWECIELGIVNGDILGIIDDTTDGNELESCDGVTLGLPLVYQNYPSNLFITSNNVRIRK